MEGKESSNEMCFIVCHQAIGDQAIHIFIYHNPPPPQKKDSAQLAIKIIIPRVFLTIMQGDKNSCQLDVLALTKIKQRRPNTQQNP